MSQSTRLSEKLREIRSRRGWTIDLAARQIGLHPYVLRSLEGSVRGATSRPEKITVATMGQLVRGYWPDLDWQDFQPDARLVLIPVDADAKRALFASALHHRSDGDGDGDDGSDRRSAA